MTDARKLGLRNLVAVVACATLILGSASNAWAVVLAYEGFDYTAGTLLYNDTTAVGLNGGTGWAGAWDGTQAASGASAIQATSLSYTDGLGNALVTSGQKLLATGAGDNGGGPGTLSSQPGRSLAARRTSPASGDTVTTWISFLGQRTGDLDPSGTFAGTYRRGANLALFDLGGTSTQTEKFNMGESSNQQYPLAGGLYEDRWQTRLPGVPATVIVPQPYPQNPEGSATSTAAGAQVRDGFAAAKFANFSLFVMRIDHVAGDSNAATTGGNFGGNDNIYVWINPNLNSTPSDASASIKNVSADIVAAANALATPVAPFNGTATSTGNGAGGEFDFNRIRLFAGNIAGTTPFAQLLLDEIRIGETFADVAPFTPAVVGLPGDYNNNHKVDAADYTVWRDNLGALTETSLNGNGNGLNGVDAADYTLWKNHFGESNGSGALSSVPEPSSLVLLLAIMLGTTLTRRREG